MLILCFTPVNDIEANISLHFNKLMVCTGFFAFSDFPDPAPVKTGCLPGGLLLFLWINANIYFSFYFFYIALAINGCCFQTPQGRRRLSPPTLPHGEKRCQGQEPRLCMPYLCIQRPYADSAAPIPPCFFATLNNK